MKDYLNLLTDDNNVKKMEIVSIFNIDNSSYNYIIYRELDKSHYYVAKYIGDEVANLSTDLSKEEFDIASKVLEGVVGENEVRN